MKRTELSRYRVTRRSAGRVTHFHRHRARRESDGRAERSPNHARTSSRQCNEVWNGRGDLDRVEDVVTDDFVSHNPILAGPVRGPDGCRELPTMFRSLFADVEMEFGGVMAQNDRVPLGLTTHATSVEAFAGVAPTNQELAITGRCFERFVDGKIAARFSTTSRCRLPTSIGLIHRKEATPS